MVKIIVFLLRSFSRLPMGFWYFCSDLLFFFQEYIIKYRKSIIYYNLKNSFPEQSEEELKRIHTDFNRNFCDYIFETIKSLSISERELAKRHTYSNIELFEELHKKGQNTMMLAGHIFNWEWLLGVIPAAPLRNPYAVFHGVKSKLSEQIVNSSRERFGNQAINMKHTTRMMMKTPNDGKTTFLMVADQSPFRTKIQYWLRFLNQETPVFIGFDKLAKKLNYAVIYCSTEKIKRGHYHTTFIEIKPKNQEFEEYEITHQFFELLEKTIQKDPSNWLWSHKRWKHKKPKV